MGHLVFAVAADLIQDPPPNGPVKVGPETARVCDRAIEVAREQAAPIILTAGFSPHFRCFMGDGPMHDYLLKKKFSAERIYIFGASEFTTQGEAEACASFLAIHADEYDTVYIVCRWWHMPRALLLLRRYLRELKLRQTVVSVPVPSRDLRGILREVFVAFWKNIPAMI